MGKANAPKSTSTSDKDETGKRKATTRKDFHCDT